MMKMTTTAGNTMMMTMAATFFLLWHGSGPSHLAEAYFVPGVNPHSYKEADM